MPSYRFFTLIACLILGLCTGYSALVLSSATWAEARQLDMIFPFYAWRTQSFTAVTYENTRAGLGLASLLLMALAAGLTLSAHSRKEIQNLGNELRQAKQGTLRRLTELTNPQRQLALALLFALTAVRLYFSLYNPEYDDAVSYEVFVSKGLLATSAYYPIPNNHVFSNTISLLFYQVNPGFWWSMRLPVFLISISATIVLFAALLRQSDFRIATITTMLFCWLQLSLYHAGVGRGYWLLILMAGIVFFCTLELTRKAGQLRAAWTGLMLAGVLGSYAVPTFVLVLASSFSWLGISFLRHGQWVRSSQLVAVAVVIGLSTTALYSPLLLISGYAKFTGNGFVTALSPIEFWRGLPEYIWHNEGFLAGQRTLGAFITVPVLAMVGWLLYQTYTDRLPAWQSQRLRRMGVPALWFMGLPYAVIMIQRVFAPERVMLYKAFFFFILVGLVVDYMLDRWPTYHMPRRLLAVLAILFATYETYSVVRVNPVARASNAAYHAGLHWLVTQPAGPILIPEPTHNLFFRFYAHSEERQRTWQIDESQQAHTHYTYVVAFPQKRGFFQPEFPFPPAYHNSEVVIYVVPKEFSLNTKPWRH